MKIEAGASALYTAQPSMPDHKTLRASTMDIGANVTKIDSPIAKKIDFTSMTRQGLRDWSNGQIRNGEMSLDDGLPFMAMTMKIPASSEYGGELSAATDTERFDFTQKIRDGIDGAASRNDANTLKMLQSAKSIMERFQGQTIGIDVRA